MGEGKSPYHGRHHIRKGTDREQCSAKERHEKNKENGKKGGRPPADLDKDEVIGFAGIMIVADEAELLNIAVLEGYRRQGVAQKLLTELFLRAKNGGAYRMLLEVRKGNLGARQLYGQNHFGIIGERKNYYSNPTEDAIIMEKLL